MCAGCAGALRDGLRGIAVLAALGGLAGLLLGLRALLPLGASALDPTVSWFALLLCSAGLVLVLLGGTAGLGFAGPIHCVSAGRVGAGACACRGGSSAWPPLGAMPRALRPVRFGL